MSRQFAAVLLAIGALAAPAGAASFDDPEWPCIQRKVPTLSVGQMWAGPLITDEITELARTPEVADLAAQLALRRVALPEAEQMIADFAAEHPDDQMLTAVFAKTFDLISNERTTIMAGIARYAGKQAELSDLIASRRDEISTLKAAENPDYDKIEEWQDYLVWDERIFSERSQSLTYVCETPVILEQRIFAIGRALQSHLGS